MHAASGSSVNLRFTLPAAHLRPYVTTYYATDAVCSPCEPWLEDYLHPEWVNLRFLGGTEAQSLIGPGRTAAVPGIHRHRPHQPRGALSPAIGPVLGGWAAAGRLGGVVRGAGG
jgi:hypothetical protein